MTMNHLTTKCGTKTLVDADISKKYGHIKFYLVKGYVAYYERGSDGKMHTRKLHRLILGAKPGQEVDHKNRNKLDNRRSNIWICTRSENLRNKASWGRWPIKGVTFDKNRGRFRYIEYPQGEKPLFFGSFDTFEEVAKFVEARAK